MKQKINILLFITLIVNLILSAQEVVPTAIVCPTATVKQYYIDEIPGAKYHWMIEGGTIISANSNNDTIVASWSKDSVVRTLSVKAEVMPDCFTETKYLKVDFSASAFLDIGTDIKLCFGEKFTFQPNYTYPYYKWQDGSFNSTFVGTKTQNIKLEVIDDKGCIGSDSALLYVYNQVHLPADTFLKKDGSVVLDAGNIGVSYKWSTDETSQSIIVKPTGGLATEIKVSVTNSLGCISSDSMVVYFDARASSKTYSNAFTPNGDGKNDTWTIPLLEFYPNCSVTIYDRWGRSVFKSDKGYSKPWDGTYNGIPLPMSSYYYLIDLKNGTFSVAGSITIIR